MINDWDGPREEAMPDKKLLLATKLAELDRVVTEIKQLLNDLVE